MKAIFRNSYGTPDVLELKDVPAPIPGDNDLLIKVQATSVNPLDWHVLSGEPFLVRLMGFGLLKPKHNVIGADMAGRVEAVGKDVTQFKVGDEVFGSGMGSFAEYARLRENHAVHKPAGVSFEQAAAVPVAGLTALQALRNQGKLQSGQDVLVNGASGGVGTFAVQIAKAMGAQVTGVCSGGNTEMVRSIGADTVIDYKRENYWEKDEKYDLIIDNAAFYSMRLPLSALKPDGVCVVVGGKKSAGSFLLSMITNPVISMIKKRKIATLIANINQADLVYVKELLEGGKIVPVVGRTFSLAETPDAMRQMGSGHTRGKMVVVV